MENGSGQAAQKFSEARQGIQLMSLSFDAFKLATNYQEFTINRLVTMIATQRLVVVAAAGGAGAAVARRFRDNSSCFVLSLVSYIRSMKYASWESNSLKMTSILGASVVEKLSFYNHTECECREKSEYDTNEKSLEQRFYRHHQLSPQPQNMRRAPPRKSCRCPSEFTPKITQDGECQCYCYEYNQNCIKTKRGKGYFSLSDRLCIQNNECVIPICEFGEYMRREGKCPRKRDKFDAIINFGTSFNHRYRS
ncbi:hypothetical protein M0804_004775 [Polistes exclamans]|nr:hypothetical protein M0804_004775 [Polistes exclamans]